MYASFIMGYQYIIGDKESGKTWTTVDETAFVIKATEMGVSRDEISRAIGFAKLQAEYDPTLDALAN